MKDIRKKADVKSAAIGKDRYKCHRYINRIHYNIQTKNIYGQNGGSIFDNCSNIVFSNRIHSNFGLMILLSRLWMVYRLPYVELARIFFYYVDHRASCYL